MTADYDDLLKKYQALLEENNQLRDEIVHLRQKYGIPYEKISEETVHPEISDDHTASSETIWFDTPKANINNHSGSREKIQFFMSLFKGREDVFARRWENRKKETSGYSPACANEWKSGIQF